MAAVDEGSLKRDPAQRLSMLATAIVGRKISVVAGADDRTFSDGERIFVASEDTDPLVVQAALMAAGSLEPRIVSKLTGRRRLRHRYLTLEAIRALHVLRVVVPRHVADRVAAIYDGPPATSPHESLGRARSDAEDVPEAPEWLGTIRPARVIMAASPVGGGAPTDKDLRSSAAEDELPELDDDESERSRIMELFQAPGMQLPLAKQLQKLLGMGRSPDAERSGGEQLPMSRSRRAGKVGNDRPLVVEDATAPGLEGPPVGRFYPEWDCGKRRHLRDWCAVAEYDPPPSEEEPVLDSGDDRRLLRELARLGLAHERHRRRNEGDVLDVTALIELMVDKATGAAGDERVYEVNRRTAHDLGVLVLLDATGSTEESDKHSRVFDEQRAVAGRLIEALDQLGNWVALYGFQSWGRQNVKYLRVKGFDDSYDHAGRRRLACLEPAGFTRLGAAVRHGTYLLTTRAGTSSMLLIVVGDGFPYDDGYEGRYAREDARRALAEAVREGVGCACISVQTSTEADLLKQVWGGVPYEVLERPGQLSRRVAPLLMRALKEAAASRRRVTRPFEATRPARALGHPH